MPKIAESVLVPYCDFCQETNERTRAHLSCKLCGSLLCWRHQVGVSFQCAVDRQQERESESDLLRRLLLQVPTSVSAYVCPECAADSSLSEIVRRITELKVTPSNGAT